MCIRDRENTQFYWCQLRRKFQYHSVILFLPGAQVFFGISLAHHKQKHPVQSNRCLNNIRSVVAKRLTGSGIYIIVEILYFLFAVLLVILQIVIRTGVYSFHLFESYWKIVFDIACGIGIMSEFNVIVKPVLIFRLSLIHI